MPVGIAFSLVMGLLLILRGLLVDFERPSRFGFTIGIPVPIIVHRIMNVAIGSIIFVFGTLGFFGIIH